jgi:hypothetical protein
VCVVSHFVLDIQPKPYDKQRKDEPEIEGAVFEHNNLQEYTA